MIRQFREAQQDVDVTARDCFLLETLEPRMFLSVVSDIVVHPNLDFAPHVVNSTVAGYTPQKIRHAYGFDQVSFSSSVKGDGSAQTIAIVDAFDNPSISSDLHTFDSKFGLSDPPVFKKVSQTGSSTSSIDTDSGWAWESALDVEWAHAVAPKANILLVEANSNSLGDLLTAVDYARKAPGVSAVSMSWGADEFWSETYYDRYFTTPAGHPGVTFVAASGDSGSWWGPEWPASSPTVLSVGGTNLHTSDSSGSYSSESGWSYSTGGISYYEDEPSYQSSVQSTGGRSSPDVSYNASPSTGFAVYSSVPYYGFSGWDVIGGTSAGAPQWAALVAIANQGRALGSKGALDGATGVLPSLYKLSGSAYSTNFRDITSGRSSYFTSAGAGYDLVTGLGSPRAKQIIGALVGTGGAPISPNGPNPNPNLNPKTVHNSLVPGDHDRDQHELPTPPRQLPPPTQAPPTDTTSPTQGRTPASDPVTSAVTFIARPAGAATLGVVSGAAAILNSASISSTTSITGRGIASSVTASHPFAVAASRWGVDMTVTVLPASHAHATPLPAPNTRAPLVEQLASIFVPRKVFDIAHLGSPYTLLSDSIAAFADESAAIHTALAHSGAHLAWSITAAVIAADIFLLTYCHRRGNKSRRMALQRS